MYGSWLVVVGIICKSPGLYWELAESHQGERSQDARRDAGQPGPGGRRGLDEAEPHQVVGPPPSGVARPSTPVSWGGIN